LLASLGAADPALAQKQGVGIVVTATLAVGGMIWTATQVVLRALHS
jgi:hypothetical protein